MIITPNYISNTLFITNGKSFHNDFHQSQCSTYPQLFSAECYNIHSNKKDGYIYKINCYNGLTDQLQINFSQRPIENMNLIKKIFEKLGADTSAIKFSNSILKLKEETKTKFEQLRKNVSKLFLSESPVRAEFRVPIDRALSMVSVIENKLNEYFIHQHVVILYMITLTKILHFWIEFFERPILNSISQVSASFINDIQSGNTENDLLLEYIPTISAFESLTVHTLFSGRTNSYISKILWNKNVDSFELADKINKYNRVDFSGSKWLKAQKLIKGSAELLDSIISKQHIKNGQVIAAAYKLLHRVKFLANDVRNLRMISIELWASYFQFVKTKAPNDFVNDPSTTSVSSVGKVSSLNLSEKVKFSQGETIFEYAVESVFSLNLFNSGSSVWNVPYLMAYSELTKSSQKKVIIYK